MKIDSSSTIASLVQGGKSQPVTKADSHSASAGQSDSLSLTDAAASLQGLERAIAAHPVVNDHRVEQIQQVVSSGGPKIDPSHLATKILNFETALNNARSGV